MTERLVVLGGLDLDARREFIASASGVIEKAKGHIKLDCAQLDVADGPTLGMLVMVARFAQRRGKQVVLDTPSVRVRRDLDEAGVTNLFAWPV
jgi:anti-anti-sigma regulatory factor